MSKKKQHFDCYVEREDDIRNYLFVENDNYQQVLRIPELLHEDIEKIINALELFKENIDGLLNALVEHAQELEDE